jgi:hypothetical protein
MVSPVELPAHALTFAAAGTFAVLTSLGAAAIVHRAERRLLLIALDRRPMIGVRLPAMAALHGRTTGG